MLDVVVMFFMFGLIAGLLRSELTIPPALYDSLTIFLLIAIGIKGGEGLSKQDLLPLIPQIGAVITLCILQTLLAFSLLRTIGRLNRPNAAAMAAHYGSVSVATFAVVVSWLTIREIEFEPQMTAILAIMEIPAILLGIVLAKGISAETKYHDLLHETFLGKGIALLLGGMAIGWAAGTEGLASIKPVFYDLFKGVLALFLLEMGLIVSRQIQILKHHSLLVLSFGILMPICSALLGWVCAQWMGLSIGGTTILMTLAASASYIAVPAAMRLSVPEANPSLSLGASLGVTFPFNIVVGIPVYYQSAVWAAGAL